MRVSGISLLLVLLYNNMVAAYSSYVYMPWRQQYSSTSQPVPIINDCALCEKCTEDAEAHLVLARTNHFLRILIVSLQPCCTERSIPSRILLLKLMSPVD